MNTYTKEELEEILAEHGKWLRGEGGKRADMRNAAMRNAVMSGAAMRYADMRNANWKGAIFANTDLSSATLPDGWSYASVSFSGHGECGRRLHALRRGKDAPIEFHCGCFIGDEEKLREYISKGGKRYKKSRTLALDTIIVLINA